MLLFLPSPVQRWRLVPFLWSPIQYFGHFMRRVDSLEKTLRLGGIGGRRRGRQRMRWLDGITDSMDVLPGEVHGQRSLAGPSPWGHKESDRLTSCLVSPEGVSGAGREHQTKGREGALSLIPFGGGLSAPF